MRRAGSAASRRIGGQSAASARRQPAHPLRRADRAHRRERRGQDDAHPRAAGTGGIQGRHPPSDHGRSAGGGRAHGLRAPAARIRPFLPGDGHGFYGRVAFQKAGLPRREPKDARKGDGRAGENAQREALQAPAGRAFRRRIAACAAGAGADPAARSADSG